MAISSSGLLSAAKSSSMMQSERRELGVRASRADWYQSAIFAPCPCGPVQKCLLGTSQTLLKTASAGCRLRVLAERFHPIETKKHAKGRRKIDLWRASFYRLCCRSGCGVSSAKNRSIFFCARKSCCISSRALRYSR